jgi:hypothetical protein
VSVVIYDETIRGHFRRVYDGRRIRHYWRGIRVPWIVWAMFS